MEKLLGKSQKEIKKYNFLDFVHPADIQKTLRVLDELNQDKTVHSFVNRFKVGENSCRFIEWRSVPVGEFIYSAARDITERREAEKIIEQTRQNYETFFNTTDDFLFVLDEQKNIIFCNETVFQRLGYTLEDLKGKPVIRVHPKERREEVSQILQKMLQGDQETCPVPLMKKSGKTIPVETRIKRGLWNGKPAIFGVSKDISNIKLSEEKFSRAFHYNASMMAISLFDSGKFIDVNQSLLDVSGYDRQEIIGKTALELNLYENIEHRTHILDILKKNQPVRNFETRFRTKNGALRTILLSVDPVFIGDDKCLLTVILDLTERKQMEQEVWNAKVEADKANKAKSEFLSRMSHELRTPLNSILGFSQLLEMGELDEKQKKGVKHILNSGRHLLDLINEVLEISRIESGRISLSLERVKLTPLILEVTELINPLALKNNISFNLDNFSENETYVQTDRKRLKQILLNLLGNAVKYNVEGGSVDIKVSRITSTENKKSFIRIAITDTGVGIAPENIQKAFTPFERIGMDQTPTEGTGLGLAVVKNLSQALGAMVGANSKKGEGSTFWIDLPLLIWS